MVLLLDTHAFIWYLEGDAQLPGQLRQRLDAHAERVFISLVSFWEIAIKSSLGKLPLKHTFPDLRLLARVNNLVMLVPLFEDTQAVLALHHHHRDPFDRMLVAQAMTHGLTIVTKDPFIPLYGVPVLW